MIARHGSDTTIGWCPGPDEGNDHENHGQECMDDVADWGNDWAGTPELGVYSYPSGGPNEAWVWKSAGAGPVSIRAMAIPQGFTFDQAMKGNCDGIWRDRAASLVHYGLGAQCRYLPGYEGNGKNFNGSAGQIGDANWAAAVSRQIRIMREVQGFDPWIGINYTVYNARQNKLNPELAFGSITEEFQSVDMDWYDTDDYTGKFKITDVPACIDYMHRTYEAQYEFCQTYGLPLGLDEWGALWKQDGHGGGDRTEVIAACIEWVKAHNVSHLTYYNGTNLPGDDARIADYSGTAYTDAARYPKVAPWVREYLDPALFVGRDTPTEPPTEVVEPPIEIVEPPVTEIPADVQAQLDNLDARLAAVEGWWANCAAAAQATAAGPPATY